jgi:hypothetical protein
MRDIAVLFWRQNKRPSTARAEGLDVIVTYDADITTLGKLAKVKVCTPGDLLKGTTRPLFPDHP